MGTTCKREREKNGLVELIKVRNNMAKSYYIVTTNTYIGHDPFDDKNAVGGMDIQTICKSFDDAHAYIRQNYCLQR